jgi:hypothetical protein
MKNPILVSLLLLFFLFKVQRSFSQSWQWLKGSTSLYSGVFVDGEGVSVDGRGNIYSLGYVGLTGASTGEVTVFSPHTITDSSTFSQMYITKSNSSGTFLWVTASQFTNGYPIGIVCDDIGNVYLYGAYSTNCHFTSRTISVPSPSSAYFLAKFDSSGNIRWLKNVAIVDSIPLHLSTSGIAIDKLGAVYVTGSFPNSSITIGTATLPNADVSGSTFDIFAAKYDSVGNVLWAKKFGGTSNEQVEGISVTDAGDAYLAGFYYSPAISFGSTTLINSLGGLDTPYIFLTKLDGSGASLWANSVKGNKYDNIGSLACDKRDNVYMAGGYNNSRITFGTTALTSAGSGDAYLVKYSAVGSLAYANTIGGNNTDYGYCVAVDSCEHAWICGMMGAPGLGAYSIHIGTHVLNSPTGANDPFFLVEYDSAGTYLNSLTTQSGGEDQANAIAVDNQGNLYLSADYDVSSFTLGSTTLTLGSTAIENMYLAKYYYGPGACSGGSTTETSGISADIGNVQIFPNPATNELTISSAGIIKRVEIFNLLGQVVCARVCNTTKFQIDIASLRPGLYVVKVNGTEVRQMIKE